MSKKPNVLFIMGDDIGVANVSCYTHGVMGYKTPNIDRIANEGVMFTDFYGEQSCTAGRSAFCTGQNPYRTGLSKVGMPGADFGMKEGTATIGWAFKESGYRTGQFGKNHFGDLDSHLPTNHGFDEFFGVLYHLNASEEPEHPDYPSEEDFPGFREQYGPRGVIRSKVNGPIEDTGQLTIKRMETVDDEFRDEAQRFIRRSHESDEPWFVWYNTTGMHCFTHTKEESLGQAGRWQSPYHDTMVDHDKNIGSMLDLLDELGVTEDTIVVYTTDNGAMLDTWPDSGMTMFRSEKNTNWEGAYRVPCVARYPKVWREGEILNDIMSLNDWLPTLLSTACGDKDIKDRLKEGTTLAGQTFKAHLDGFDQSEWLEGKAEKSERDHYFYVTDDGDLAALRYDNWKMVFLEQQMPGSLQVWANPFTPLRVPKLFNLRTDPYERADLANTYNDWLFKRIFLLVPAQQYVAKMLASFDAFPPQQKPPSFSVDQVLKVLEDSAVCHN